MKLFSYIHAGQPTFGVVSGDRVIDLAPVAHEVGATLREALERAALDRIREYASGVRPNVSIDEIEFLPVISNPQKILCVGINYRTHMEETGRAFPQHPMIFTRFADSQVGHLQPILRPAVSDKLDYEGELAVVIGKQAFRVRAEQALDHVAGYACYNDGSIRDWQKHTIQFVPGKNFRRTGGFGPWLVTSDELPDPSKLTLTTRLNGEVMQHTPTDDMFFSVEQLIEYCSTFTPLNPGDVIVTGTTGGVGAFRTPPVWMKAGDIAEVEISGIGTLRNPIANE
jgi:2-keto-4-pentenoate hydratase/2-oxohepta-3-ene-1,7-dioic acid hydratase in catechol pathway